MQIRVYGSFVFTNNNDNCADNGDLSILYDVPKSWVKWDEERRQKLLDKNYDKINKEFNDAMYVSASYGYYDDIEQKIGDKKMRNIYYFARKEDRNIKEKEVKKNGLKDQLLTNKKD